MLPHMEVVQYYDVISSHKLDLLKYLVRHEYKTAGYPTGGEKPEVNHRKQISALATIFHENPAVLEIEAIVGRMTGLKVSEEDFLESEVSQVVGYNPGGHLIVHEDWVIESISCY